MGMHGLLLLDKPQGRTSADIVRVVKQRLQSKTGHLGTLDPFATGVLPICVGEATKIAQFLNAADKDYTGVIRLGQQTDTGDPTGTVIGSAPVPPLSPEQLAAVAHQLCGTMEQVPPMYSAIKHQGTPLYKLARRGIAVERAPRPVHITALQLTARDADTLAFAVSCSKGTYIRTLAEQIAAALGTVAHLESLRRTRFGAFRLEQAVTLAAFEAGAAPLISLRQALAHLREIPLDAAAAQRARQGYEPLLGALRAATPAEAAKLVGPGGELAAVIVSDGRGHWRFGRVFAGT